MIKIEIRIMSVNSEEEKITPSKEVIPKKMTTYDKVKALAEKQQKSIASVEAAAGVANGTISGWRTGRPYAETLQKISLVLGCQMEDLLPDTEG